MALLRVCVLLYLWLYLCLHLSASERSLIDRGLDGASVVADALELGAKDISSKTLDDLSVVADALELGAKDISSKTLDDVSVVADALELGAKDISSKTLDDLSVVAEALELGAKDISSKTLDDLSVVADALGVGAKDISSKTLDDLSVVADDLELGAKDISSKTLDDLSVVADALGVGEKDISSKTLDDLSVVADALGLGAKDISSKTLDDVSVVADALGLGAKDISSKTLGDNTFPHLYKRSVFPCPVLPPSARRPTSVHRLRPADIQIVAALGDSLTTGRGAIGGVRGLLLDYRGLVFSIGGDEDYFTNPTVPNILRQYNRKLYGYSQGTDSETAGFNVAVVGVESNEMLQQAQTVVNYMKADRNVRFANDWKLITILIGVNDLCRSCNDEVKFRAANYRRNLQAALDYLLANVPRAFVNIVQVLNVEEIAPLDTTPICEFFHLLCECASNPNTPEDKTKLIELREEYQAVARQLVLSGRYDKSNDFTVVIQPFYENTSIPLTRRGEPDLTYFASDCYHLSQKANSATAVALWNNMIEPVGSKQTSWTPGEVIKCPTEASPYLYTAKNSKKGTVG